MKSTIYFGVILLLTYFSMGMVINAQAPTYQWAEAIGGKGFDFGNAIATDPKTGDVYSTGVFSRTIDFDPGEGTFNLTSAGANDIFITKSNASGHFKWAVRIGGDSNDSGFSMAVDASGNVYVTGQFSNTVDFDPGERVFKLTSAGLADMFILKIDVDGHFIWAKSIGGEGYDVGRSLAVDPSGSGDIYIKGEFYGTVDFDPGAQTFNLTSASRGNGVFISKLDSFGNFEWALKLGADPLAGGMGIAPFGGFANSIIVDQSGSIYTTGWFHGTVDIVDGEGTFKLAATGDEDIFILKLSSDGNFIWAKSLQGTHRSLGHTMAIDGLGNVYTSGAFQGTVDFDPGMDQYSLTADGTAYEDAFILKMDSDGNFIWVKTFGGSKGDSGTSLVVDPQSGNIYTTGIFTATADFDPGKGVFNLTSNGDYDVFISKLDSDGNFIWAKTVGGVNIDYGYSIALHGSGNIHVVGGFTGPSISFGNTTFYNAVSTGYPLDIFMAKLDDSVPETVADINYDIIIYPSPAKDEIKIDLSDEEVRDVKVSIFTLGGDVVYSRTDKNVSQELTIDISDLHAAMYCVVVDINKNRWVKQVVKVED